MNSKWLHFFFNSLCFLFFFSRPAFSLNYYGYFLLNIYGFWSSANNVLRVTKQMRPYIVSRKPSGVFFLSRRDATVVLNWFFLVKKNTTRTVCPRIDGFIDVAARPLYYYHALVVISYGTKTICFISLRRAAAGIYASSACTVVWRNDN